MLRDAVTGGEPVLPCSSDAGLSPRLTVEDVDAAERVVALIGPEPVMAALDHRDDRAGSTA